MPRIRVGIWGVFGRGNFGNEATLTAFLNRLGSEQYDSVLFCEDPDAATAIHGIPARRLGAPVDVASASGLRRTVATLANRLRLLTGAIRAARSVGSIVIAGTGGLERYGSGAFGTPYEIWALGVGARISRRPFILLDIGVEVLPRPLARFFVRDAVRSATYRSYRDTASRKSVKDMGVRGTENDPVVTDLAFALQPPRAELRTTPAVSVGVMDYWGRDSSHESSETVHERYAAKCIELVKALREHGRAVRLVGGDDGDLVFARSLAETLADGIPVVDARSPNELVIELSGSEVVVASRYHTLIMSLLAGTPAVSIGYSEKHRSILLQLGLPEAHYDIESFDPEAVAAAVEEMASNRSEFSTAIEAGVDAARRRLDSQWPDVETILQTGRR